MIFCNGITNFPNKLLQIIKEQQEKDVPNFLKQFSIYDCIPKLKWSGGRVVKELNTDFNFDIIKKFNDCNVGFFPTLTNTIYNNLDDPLLIKTLNILNQCNLNGVILASDKLYHFIKNNYKNIQISCSISKIKPFKQLTIDQIKQLENKYNYICCKQNLYFDSNFYNKINKSQYEILLNNACPWNCPNYKQHYKYVSIQCIKYIDGLIDYKSAKNINYSCFYHKHSPIFDLNKLINIGYTTFKFSLRGDPLAQQISCITNYLNKLNIISNE